MEEKDLLQNSWFVHPYNKTGCRFIVVDAYNKENVLHFYGKNGFKFLYFTEDLEKEANHIPEDEHLESRMMYPNKSRYIILDSKCSSLGI